VVLQLLDVDATENNRYGVIGPSSPIIGGSTTQVRIADSPATKYPSAEWRQWAPYVGLQVRVHSDDFTFDQTVTLQSLDATNPYLLNVVPPLGSAPPSSGWSVDMPAYDGGSSPSINAAYKFRHGFMGAEVAVTAGVSHTRFTVGAGDIGKFKKGFPLIVHNDDFSSESPETTVSQVIGNDVVVAADLGFTPDNTMTVSLLGFSDGGFCYRMFL
jgi:hypothetical protein